MEGSAMPATIVLYKMFEEIKQLPRFYDHLKAKGFVYNPYSMIVSGTVCAWKGPQVFK